MQSSTAPEQIFGYDVIDDSGSKIGSVDNVWVDDATGELEFVGVKTGWLMGKTHVIPTANAQIGDGQIQVPYSEDQIKGAPSYGGDDELSPENEGEIYSYYGLDRSTAPSPTGLPTGGTGTSGYTTADTGTTDYAADTTATTGYSDTTSREVGTGETQEVTLSEEELAVGKRQVQAGGVRLRKVVRTEHQEVPVELRREDVEIERIPASEMTNVPDTAFQEQEIDVPVMREEPVVEKQAHVTGGVRVNKDVQTETQTVGGEVRREEVDVDRGVDTTGTTGYTDTTSADNEGSTLDRLGNRAERTVDRDL
jgi:uncharacterized protein (TIGR02271 family)